MTEVDTFEHAGLTVRISFEEYDTEHANPRAADGNLGVMFCDYNRYTLGDSSAPDPRDQRLACPSCQGSGDATTYEVLALRPYGHEPVKGSFASVHDADAYITANQPADVSWVSGISDCPHCEGSGEVEVGIVEYLKREHGASVILPLFVYEHGGITMSSGGRLDKGEDDFTRTGRFVPGDGWDTSSVGVIFDTAETRELCEWTGTDEQLEARLQEEVRYYAAYLEGMVFRYDILDADGETIGGCGLFLEPDIRTDDCHIREQARSEAEDCAERIAAEAIEAHRWACADVVTV